MLDILLLAIGAVATYLICSLNPAIIFSHILYNEDIRKKGSGNPGFTNFSRVYGLKWGMPVMLIDLLKAAVCVYLFGSLYSLISGGSFQFAAALCGVFAMAGHAYPIWYSFKGGKGFLVYMSIIWFVDWKAGLVGVCVLALFLFTTKYMSLASLSAVILTVIYLTAFKAASIPVIVLCFLQVFFVVIRHKTNILRLLKGTETKFKIKKL